MCAQANIDGWPLQQHRFGIGRRCALIARGFARWLAIVGLPAMVFWVSGCMERLFYYPQQGVTPAPSHFRGAESVWFNSADGTRLHGWFIPAQQGSTTEPAPTILHAHGNAGNIDSHIWFTEYLPAAGFNLFVFDYRGYGQSEGSARRRKPLIEDTEAALDALLKRADVDPQRIGMYGQSLGGSIGLNVMSRRPEIRAAVLESAFASWREEAACAMGGDPPGLVARLLAALLIPDSHRPDQAIACIDRPILLLHGSDDRTIPPSHSRRLTAACPAHTRLVELPGGDHNTLRESHPEIEQMVIDFYRANLAAEAAPAAAR